MASNKHNGPEDPLPNDGKQSPGEAVRDERPGAPVGDLRTGRNGPRRRLTARQTILFVTIGLAGGLILQPRLAKLYAQKYTRPGAAPTAEQLAAAKSYSNWRTTTQVLNFLALAGLTLFTWQTIHVVANGTRFTSSKFRS